MIAARPRASQLATRDSQTRARLVVTPFVAEEMWLLRGSHPALAFGWPGLHRRFSAAEGETLLWGSDGYGRRNRPKGPCVEIYEGEALRCEVAKVFSRRSFVHGWFERHA